MAQHQNWLLHLLAHYQIYIVQDQNVPLFLHGSLCSQQSVSNLLTGLRTSAVEGLTSTAAVCKVPSQSETHRSDKSSAYTWDSLLHVWWNTF